MLEVPWTEYRQEKGSHMVPCQEKIIPRRYSGATQAFLARNFRLLIFFKNKKIKKPSTRICSSKNLSRINIRRPKKFDAYTDWYCIRREAFAAVLIFICSCTKLNRYEKAPPPLNTPAVVCPHMYQYSSTVHI